MKILFAGGGTLGSVSPLLALVPQLRKRGAQMTFVGTRRGPERLFVEKEGLRFVWITAPKFRRYFSWRYLFVPAELLLSLCQSLWLLLRVRPNIIVSAGGFVSVPIIWVGWLLRIPSVIHQQDIQVTLSNKLVQPVVKKITVAFEDSLKYFPHRKTEWIGNPVRDLTPTTDSIHLDAKFPTVLIFGGGTGATAINELVSEQLCDFANVIHVTGSGRIGKMQPIHHPRYHGYELLGEEMKEALHKADIVVARAGLGTISELAALGKPAIIIPIPGTHQEQNAAMLQQHHATIIINQQTMTTHAFNAAIHELLQDSHRQKELRHAISTLHKFTSTKALVVMIINAAK
ncbi:MAG: UDP-N-acetylglucosamine--N-acetylmuramyl-(pentapeptide) pyrophosphoryl-undecaprenol N-acetylglucosamine transferase [Candidatus Kerfeldbacteria bacterium]|nr:UDP-N-acetylglucosamine--N-acetylmuramyl-(pentapeptide) pyrophosphoryl-undecaprenol N-acetylglucosamine transferase [Candidatus Kerfeldbacteria bacterium]